MDKQQATQSAADALTLAWQASHTYNLDTPEYTGAWTAADKALDVAHAAGASDAEVSALVPPAYRT